MDIRPAAVIFDLDGTLIDSLPGIEFSVKAAFEACGVSGTTNDLRSKFGPPIRTILAQACKVTDRTPFPWSWKRHFAKATMTKAGR